MTGQKRRNPFRRHYRPAGPTGSRQNGLTLIEVLIALIILSLGLIGIGVMHLNAMRFAHSSYYSSIASSVALDLEEQLWLRVADTPGACVTADDVNEVVEFMGARWSGTDADRTVIPGLAFAVDNIAALEDQWTEAAVTLSWTDNRFDDQPNQSYSVIARVVCRIPPEEEEEEV